MNEDIFARLNRSAFRSRFKLSPADKDYVREKGVETIRRHAEDFVARRLAPDEIPNDGRQTPMRSHPVFVAQHATGTCCRQCLQKWHRIAPGKELTAEQQRYVVDIILHWIENQLAR